MTRDESSLRGVLEYFEARIGTGGISWLARSFAAIAYL